MCERDDLNTGIEILSSFREAAMRYRRCRREGAVVYGGIRENLRPVVGTQAGNNEEEGGLFFSKKWTWG